MTASLLPVTKAQFSFNAVPLAFASIYFYDAGTSNPRNTWTDSAQGTANTNPVILDANGQADIWISGAYKVVVVPFGGSLSSPLWTTDNVVDVLTLLTTTLSSAQTVWAGTMSSTAPANAPVVTPTPAFTSIPVGQEIRATVFQDNTDVATLQVNSLAPVAVMKLNGTKLVNLAPGDLKANMDAEFTFNGTVWILTNVRPFAQGADIATVPAGTLDLDSSTGFHLSITGSNPVTSITLTKGQIRRITAANGFLIVAGASLSTPNGAPLSLAAGDTVDITGLAGSAVRVTSISTAKPVTSPFTSARVISGLQTANNVTDAVNNIDIGVGSACDALGNVYYLTTALTKQIQNIFAAGTNAGGLFTGAVANGTYHLWLIRNNTTGAVDAGFDTSVTGANVPAGWTKICRIWSIVRAAAAIKPYFQTGNKCLWVTDAIDVNAVSLATGNSATPALTTPVGIITEAMIRAYTARSGQNAAILIYPLQNNGLAASFPGSAGASNTGALISVGGSANGSTAYGQTLDMRVQTNSSSQIGITNPTALGAGVFYYINTYGYIDLRGRDD